MGDDCQLSPRPAPWLRVGVSGKTNPMRRQLTTGPTPFTPANRDQRLQVHWVGNHWRFPFASTVISVARLLDIASRCSIVELLVPGRIIAPQAVGANGAQLLTGDRPRSALPLRYAARSCRWAVRLPVLVCHLYWSRGTATSRSQSLHPRAHLAYWQSTCWHVSITRTVVGRSSRGPAGKAVAAPVFHPSGYRTFEIICDRLLLCPQGPGGFITSAPHAHGASDISRSNNWVRNHTQCAGSSPSAHSALIADRKVYVMPQ
jgi:hypothetical protein